MKNKFLNIYIILKQNTPKKLTIITITSNITDLIKIIYLIIHELTYGSFPIGPIAMVSHEQQRQNPTHSFGPEKQLNQLRCSTTPKQKKTQTTEVNKTMSCNSSGCQSNCYKNGDQVSDSPPPPPLAAANNSNNLCLKCKTNSPITPGSLSGDEARFCADCFRSNIYGKFRLAVTSHAMISPSDNVLVAFSGGPSSRFSFFFLCKLIHGCVFFILFY